MVHKSGKYFEDLVTWIQKSVHEKSQIIPNEKVPDIHTNRIRQIDISIRLSDGPTHLFVMVEVRDHKKPIGVNYIEEINSKKQSVGANAAFIVSRSGFANTALEKAKCLGIQTLTYEEAMKSDWSGWIIYRNIIFTKRLYNNILITLMDNSNKKLDIASEIESEVHKNPKSMVLLNNEGKPYTSIFNLADSILKPNEGLYECLEANGKRVRRGIFCNATLEPQLFVVGKDGLNHKMEKVLVEADFYIEEEQIPLSLWRYRNTESDDSIVEVATADIEIGGEKKRFEILAPNAGDSVPGGSKIQLRIASLNNE